ncbi:hypothetical protein [Virgisporangium aliadipatigenens]|uniref:hypothetical protein n=1 Tax=Virgisporangium aliadipatigenens TaxID=741659 RepID=UPI0019442C53|nr:hypothetical protein [Virgisporangium aliadipatigenens]
MFELDLNCGHCVTVSLDGWYPVTVSCCDRLGGTWLSRTFYPIASGVDYVRCLSERYENRPDGTPQDPLVLLHRRDRTDSPRIPQQPWQIGTAGRFPAWIGAASGSLTTPSKAS